MTMTYTEQAAAARKVDALLAGPDAGTLQPWRLAVLGSSTTAQLMPLVRLHAYRRGLRLQTYEAPFGLYRQEVLDPASALYAFKPQTVLFFVDHRDAGAGPAEAEAQGWESLWALLKERAGCSVVMNNFAAPAERAWGNLEGARAEQGLGRLRRLNSLLAERASGGVLILDAEHLSGVVGKERWHDARFWHHSRQAMSFEALARYAAEAAALVAALAGRSKKVLVTDLDNTLWGGIVGEDGTAGLKLDGPEGEPFVEFQKYLKGLKERGVLLAVASKNDLAAAQEPFKSRPEMVLKLSDFSAFEAGWGPKPDALKRIAAKLNVGVDALAFVDDTAMERDGMRAFLPEVAVVDLPEDPSEYVRTLDAARLFEPASVSAEDAARAAHFAAEAAREAHKAAAADLPTFLKGLGMRAEAGPFREADLERVVQLYNKTNQFNVLTRRVTDAQVRGWLKDPAVFTLQARLSDRHGDYGLVACLTARAKGGDLAVEDWLMSCRVLGRGLEQLCFNLLLAEARRRGSAALVGRFEATPKNGLVQDLYPSLGFSADGAGTWRLSVAAAKPKEVYIDDGRPDPAR
ncbi:HAD-IIIC family phosphatase [bacterium]|nr:MAG: HAD-IIIC family phosphatase [bacterium]